MKQPHKYAYAVDVHAETAAAKVVRMVGSGKRVLEIGAGPGSITRVLKEHSGCRIVAIENDESAIPALGAWCEKVHRLDLNEPGWPAQASEAGRFDVAVAADVLEHLVDPWTALRRMGEVLIDGGAVVLSLPHVGHNAVLGSLVSGSFDYREWGLLDRTHIRFFGVRDIQALVAKAGFKILQAEFVMRSPDNTEFAECWRALPAPLRRELAANRHGNVYQVVLRAVLATAPGDAVDLDALPVPAPGYSLLPGAPLKARLFHGARAIARAVLSRETREKIERALRARGLLR